jgi:hypothetical protein
MAEGLVIGAQRTRTAHLEDIADRKIAEMEDENRAS